MVPVRDDKDPVGDQRTFLCLPLDLCFHTFIRAILAAVFSYRYSDRLYHHAHIGM